jgi:predicted dehydrogenase
MRTFNWGIIGPGSIAHTFAQALLKSKQGKLYAVASRSHERAQAFASEYAVATIYADYAALMADPQVDIIYIATPHSHHFELAKQCLMAGKHLLLEKPLTINAPQTACLIALAEQHNVLFQEALWSRFMPAFAKLKAWIAEDKIGAIHYIQSDIGFDFSLRDGHRLNELALAGGALLDLGVYSISLSQFLLAQNPLSIQAQANMAKTGIDNTTLVNMQYPEGQYSQFSCSITAQCSNSMRIVGQTGYIVLPRFFWVGEQIQFWQESELVETLNFPHQQNGFEYQIAESMRCAEAGLCCSPLMPHADSLAVMQTMDTIRQQLGLHYPMEIEAL